MEIKYLQVIVMSNGEVLCLGNTIGWGKDFKKFILSDKEIAADYLANRNKNERI